MDPVVQAAPIYISIAITPQTDLPLGIHQCPSTSHEKCMRGKASQIPAIQGIAELVATQLGSDIVKIGDDDFVSIKYETLSRSAANLVAAPQSLNS